MIFADILFYFLIILGFYLVFISYWLASFALCPALVERCRERFELQPVSCVFIGLLSSAPFLLLGGGLLRLMGNGIFQGIGLLFLSTFAFGAFVGSAGLAFQIGRGLANLSDEGQRWRQVLRGGVVLGLMFLLPVIGWFFTMPVAFIGGFGAFVMSYGFRTLQKP